MDEGEGDDWGDGDDEDDCVGTYNKMTPQLTKMRSMRTTIMHDADEDHDRDSDREREDGSQDHDGDGATDDCGRRH